MEDKIDKLKLVFIFWTMEGDNTKKMKLNRRIDMLLNEITGGSHGRL